MNWIPTHEIDHNGRKVLVKLCETGEMITQAEWGAHADDPSAWHPDWELDEEDDLVFQGSTPPGESSYRKLSEREAHYIVDDERESGAFTLGEFVQLNSVEQIGFLVRAKLATGLVLLDVDGTFTFGGGAMAETTIRRVR
jgi:hypothetical protein